MSRSSSCSTSRSPSRTSARPTPCSTARSAGSCWSSCPRKGLVGLGLHGAGLPQHHQQQAADQEAGGHPGPEDPHHPEPALHRHAERARRQRRADGLPRAVHRAGDRRRSTGRRTPTRRSRRPSSTRCRSTSAPPGTSTTRSCCWSSKKFWDTLSADEKKIFEDAAVEARDYQRKVAREMEREVAPVPGQERHADQRRAAGRRSPACARR